MDTKEITELGKALEYILIDVNDKNKIGTSIEQYLYNKKEKAIAIPGMLLGIIQCLSQEIGEQERLDYRTKVFDGEERCITQCQKERCRTEEKIVFIEIDHICIDITAEPQENFECKEGRNSSNPDCMLCAFF